MAKRQPIFYYYQHTVHKGEPLVGKTIVDDGVWVGGAVEPLAVFNLPDHEYELSLDQLRKLYPYG